MVRLAYKKGSKNRWKVLEMDRTNANDESKKKIHEFENDKHNEHKNPY